MNRHRFRLAVAVLLGAAFALAASQPASAFVWLARQPSPSSPVVQAHWLPSELPLNSAINPKNNDKSNAVALAEIIAAAESWEAIATSYFTVDAHEFGPTDSIPKLAFNNANAVLFDSAGVNFPSAGVIAFVRSVIDGATGHTLDADMVFNDRDFWWSVTSPGLEPAPPGQFSVDLQSVACHEYGHYFSLDHTSVLGATMIPFIQNNTSQRTLELDDAAGNSTVYPEPSFLTDYGTISGTVVSGFNGSAVFGAHVEALPIVGGVPTVTNSISAISGEITLRNGSGEYTIHGLPPGDYAVRIVPLDGIHTTASDANIGGPYNGLDINFEPEFWDAAESGNGFVDNPNTRTDVAVTAGGATTAINLITNAFAGRVVLAQHGQFENVVTFRNTGYLAVRLDPPFDAAYTIEKVEFPSFTFNGVPATFLSAKLCVLDPATGLPNLAAPLLDITPFVGSPNGVNTVPINIGGTVGQTYFWALQFPATPPSFPNNFPFLRMDFVNMERGHFANSYSLPLSGPGAGILIERNIIVTMQCQLADPNEVPIVGPSNLGANRRATNTEFDYAKPGDVRADGFNLANNSLEQVDLVVRPAGAPGTHSLVASGGAGASGIKLDPPPPNNSLLIWSTQAVDKNGNKSVLSNVTITGLAEDADEPNGAVNQATVLTLPVVNRPETYAPAGDEDFFSLTAKPGELITATATHTGTLDGRNDPDYVLFLYDTSGEIVAFNDDFTGLNPKVTYTVPPPGGNPNSQAPRKFTIHVTDFYGSFLAPSGAPRIPSPNTYRLDVSVTTPAAAAASFARALDAEQYHLVSSGTNPSNPKLLYIIPRSAGSQDVKLRIYDLNGRLVRKLVDGSQAPGPNAAVWDGRDDHGRGLASGIYYARIQVGNAFTGHSRVTLLK